MRDAEKTVGNMIDKEKTIFVGSVFCVVILGLKNVNLNNLSL